MGVDQAGAPDLSFKADTNCACQVREASNFGERRDCRKPEILLLHYTGMKTARAALDWLCAEESGVSCHYLVDEAGNITQMVPEAMRAWHAGQSCWRDETDINSRSIGIEIVNKGHDQGYPDFPEAQIAALIELCRDIVSRHSILPQLVLAHSDVAPGRKIDPGEKFPWELLNRHGVGFWAQPAEVTEDVHFGIGENGEPIAAVQAMLALYGYCVEISGNYDERTAQVVAAFQRHFRPKRVDGVADAETIATLEGLVKST